EKTAKEPFVRMTYDEAVKILKSEETATLLDEMAKSRRQEHIDLGKEIADLKKEKGSAKKWRKAQIDERIKEISIRTEQVQEDLRNIPSWKYSAQNFEWGNDLGGSDETVLMM